MRSVAAGPGNGAHANAVPLRILMVTGIYPTDRRPDKGTFIESDVVALRDAGHSVDVVHPRPDLPRPVRYLSTAARVLWKTVTKRYDVVHGHYGLWCAVARLYWRAPLVCSFLGDDVLGTPSGDGRHSWKGEVVRRLAPLLGRLARAVVVQSPEMKRRLPAIEDRLRVVPGGVDFSQFRPMPRAEARQALGWDPDRPHVLFCADPRIPVKNFTLARQAVETLIRSGIEAELVVLHGLPHDQIPVRMNASNALLVASIHEGSPTVVKEAMACNVPVVSTDVGDVRDVVGRTDGCSVCAPDARDLAEGLARAVCRREPTSGREDMRHLDNRIAIQRLIAVYRDVVGARRCP
jgi:teichuronic acid biosynthesis glycosyltransferase TuaC